MFWGIGIGIGISPPLPPPTPTRISDKQGSLPQKLANAPLNSISPYFFKIGSKCKNLRQLLTFNETYASYDNDIEVCVTLNCNLLSYIILDSRHL